jgi:hypothetical protein
MGEGGAVEIKHGMFVHPTELGEEIIEGLTGRKTPQVSVPPFPPLPR